MTHPHDSTGEHGQLGPSADGTVMLDIGPGRGALIVHAPGTMAGAEIHIVSTEGGAALTHMAVRERLGPAGSRYAAIFPSLPPGEYALMGPDGKPGPGVTIIEGRAAEVAW